MKEITLKELRALVKRLVEQSFKEDDNDLDESEEDHEGDPRWEDHADPTGKDWDHGLD